MWVWLGAGGAGLGAILTSSFRIDHNTVLTLLLPGVPAEPHGAVPAPHHRTKSRARGARAILADQNGLLGWPKVTEAARLPGRGLEPQATNLRVRNSAQVRAHCAVARDVRRRKRRCAS